MFSHKNNFFLVTFCFYIFSKISYTKYMYIFEYINIFCKVYIPIINLLTLFSVVFPRAEQEPGTVGY